MRAMFAPAPSRIHWVEMSPTLGPESRSRVGPLIAFDAAEAQADGVEHRLALAHAHLHAAREVSGIWRLIQHQLEGARGQVINPGLGDLSATDEVD